MDDLVGWLRGVLDERERAARTLLAYAQQTNLTLKDPRLLGRIIPGWHEWPAVERMCVERLAEVEATRRILDLHGHEVHECAAWNPPLDDTYTCYERTCPTLRLLALPLADRPGYREEWKP